MQKTILALALTSVGFLCAATFDPSATGHSYSFAGAGANGDLFAATQEPDAGSEEYHVVRLTTPVNNSTGREELIAKPLVPLYTQINGRVVEQDAGGGEKLYPAAKESNPIRDRKIFDFNMYGDLPVLAVGDTAAATRTVVMIAEPTDGSKVLTNTATIRDAAGNAAETIKKVTGGARVLTPHNQRYREQRHPVVFAAVTPSGDANFAGQDGAGIALLYGKTTGLLPIDATGTRGDAKAAQLNSALIQVGGVGAVANITCMHWDSTLQRLYVGLQTTDGGVAVVTGRLSLSLEVASETMQGNQKVQTCVYDATLALRPIVANADGLNPADMWAASSADLIVADKNNGITVNSLNTMHTTTQRSYLIVGRNGNEVHSVPLVRTAGENASEAQVGTAANINNTDYDIPAAEGNTAQLYGKGVVPVGGGNAPANIENVYVKGDAVFISCAGTSAITTGIFVSTPLFNTDGYFTNWSKWQKVFGGIRNPYSFSVDNLARVNLITGVDTDTRTRLYVAGWGDAQGNSWWGGTAAAPADSLMADINAAFPSSNGGISAVRIFKSFGIESSWFDISGQITDVTLGCALGKNSLALFNSYTGGTIVGTTTAGNQVAYDKDAHFGFRSLATDNLDLGTLCCAALSTNSDEANGSFLAVGGAQGAAIYYGMQAAKPGVAKDIFNAPSVLNAGTPGLEFKSITQPDGSPYSNVRALQWHDKRLYILDAHGLHKLDASEDPIVFIDTPDELPKSTIATPAVLFGNANHSFLDLLIVGDYAFLATTNGLWTQDGTTLDAVTNTLGDGGWQEVFVKDTDSFGVCAQLSFTPAAAADQGGTLQVLTADVSLNVATVYQVAVPSVASIPTLNNIGAVAHGISSPWYYSTMLGKLREYFYTNGGVAIDAGSHHHTDTNGTAKVRVLPVTSELHNIDRWVYSLAPDMHLSDPQHTVGGIVRDPATGTLLVPGVWGLRVLQ